MFWLPRAWSISSNWALAEISVVFLNIPLAVESKAGCVFILNFFSHIFSIFFLCYDALGSFFLWHEAVNGAGVNAPGHSGRQGNDGSNIGSLQEVASA